MSDTRELLSVGVDVGTTTTQVVFSRLQLANVARPGQIPHINITQRSVLYQSPITFTPLADSETVDAARLNELVRREYAAAGLNPAQVETGAVIITGETAKKKNADEIVRALSGLAGEFVVSVAGPHVESLIAGRGAGAAQYSQTHFTTVTNLDIGGGSANSATFRGGQYVAAAAMNYGGRILEIEHKTGRVRHIAEPAKHILADCGLKLEVGSAPTLAELRRFTNRMADLTVELIEGITSPLAQKIYLTPPAAISGKGTVLMFSGGIGHYYYNPLTINAVSDATLHDDVGPLLAESLRQHAVLNTYKITRPAETVRATVLGASTQTVTLSGSTIWAEREILPLRNVPVLRPNLPGDLQPAAVAQAVAEAVRRWDVDVAADAFAVAVEISQALDYAALLRLATGLSEFSQSLPASRPLIVIIGRDYAQALGQTVKGLVPARALLVIDQVGLNEGDYIDIGLPLMDGRVVPLSVKTLVFYN
ncbi:MAG: ethanolamine ammonia-lyase reactivating factor EutA [Anaerolineales bacterium]|nr:ethanolamine ammonia-lyase reactivating factor EutA [Anaerolineales bacterium]